MKTKTTSIIAAVIGCLCLPRFMRITHLTVIAALMAAFVIGCSKHPKYYVVSGAGTEEANGNYHPVTVSWAKAPTWTIWANDNGQAYMGSYSDGGVYIWPNTGSNPGANQSYYMQKGTSPLGTWTRNPIGPGSEPPPTATLDLKRAKK
jgi:hypothetical protein